jgi:hypothetical protein
MLTWKRNTEATKYEHTPKQEFSSPGFVQASNADEDTEEEHVPTTPTPETVNSRHPRHQHQRYPHYPHRDHHAPHDHEDVPPPPPQQQNTRTPAAVITITDDIEDGDGDDGGTVLEFDSDTDSDSSSDYLSFEDSENEAGVDSGHDRSGSHGGGNKANHHKADKEARERERQRVLEAAGLIVQRDVGPPPVRPPRSRVASGSSSSASRMGKRRPAPAAPQRRSSGVYKELPPVPPVLDSESGLVSDGRKVKTEEVDDEVTEEAEEVQEEAEEVLTHEARLDDAFARYESFKNAQANQLAEANNRLSVVSTDSSITMPVSPTTTISSMSMSQTQHPPSMVHMHMQKDKDKDKDKDHPTSPSSTSSNSEGRYAHFLNFLTNSGSRATTGSSSSGGASGEGGGERRRSVGLLNISAPIMTKSNNSSFQTTPQDGPSRANSPAFGMSWASLVDKNALDGIPPGERKRQEVRVVFFFFFFFFWDTFLIGMNIGDI